jgi:F-type H+-transporting ATPase subunit a
MDLITISPQKILNIGNLNLTSAHFATILITLFLFLGSYFFSKILSKNPGRFQSGVEALVSFFYDKSKEASHSTSSAKLYTNIVLSFFIFIVIANLFTVLPLVESLLVQGKPLFSTPTAHFSLTIALALIVVFLAHVLAIKESPITHLNNLVDFKTILKTRSLKQLPNVFIVLFLGLLNIIGEFSKIISLAARLFGNVFAGVVMVIIIAGLSAVTAYVIPIPFLVIGIFSGLIQAFVFAFLAFSFITDGVNSARSR